MRSGLWYAGAGVGYLIASSFALSSWPLLIWALVMLVVLVWEDDSQ